MWIKKDTTRYVIGFIGAILFFSVVRILAYNIVATPETPFLFYMISQIGCVLIVACWMLTIYNRIIDIKVQQMMLSVGGLLILYFFMQMVKYCLFAEASDIGRYMWYGYYTPMTIIPLLLVYIIRYLAVSEDMITNKKWNLLSIPAIIISIGFITNDLHQLAFWIPNWDENGDKGRKLGPIYYMYIAYMAVLLVIGVYYAIRITKKHKDKRKGIYPFIPVFIGIFYLFILTIKDDWISINGQVFMEMAEAFSLMIICFLEVCIKIGMIQSNTGYKRLFSLSGISARLTQADGKSAYISRGAEAGFEESEDHHIVQIPVTGGTFSYDVDLSVLNRLNEELDESVAGLEARNELLRYENEISKDRIKAEEAIRIYDHISEIVQPEIKEIQKLLAEDTNDEEQFRARLVHSAVLNAYVKRRSNMELEAQKNGMLPAKELTTAIAESLEYFKLSGADTFLSYTGEAVYPAKQICRAYRAFEKVLEHILGNVDYMTVRLEADKAIYIRFLLEKKTGMPDFSVLMLENCNMECIEEGNDIDLRLSVEREGE